MYDIYENDSVSMLSDLSHLHHIAYEHLMTVLQILGRRNRNDFRDCCDLGNFSTDRKLEMFKRPLEPTSVVRNFVHQPKRDIYLQSGA